MVTQQPGVQFIHVCVCVHACLYKQQKPMAWTPKAKSQQVYSVKHAGLQPQTIRGGGRAGAGLRLLHGVSLPNEGQSCNIA